MRRIPDQTLARRRGGVAGGTTEPDHRVLFLGFEVGTSNEASKFVYLEVGEAHDDRLGVKAAAIIPTPSANVSMKKSVGIEYRATRAEMTSRSTGDVTFSGCISAIG